MQVSGGTSKRISRPWCPGSKDSVVGGGQLGAVLQTQFLEDVGEVHLDGRRADRQSVGQFLVAEAKGGLREDFLLSA